MIDDVNSVLSAKGTQRRSRMLAELQSDMRRVHRARRIRRRATATLATAMVMALVVLPWQFRKHPSSNGTREIAAEPTTSEPINASPLLPPGASAMILRVQTDPTVLDRYRAASRPRAVALDDEALLVALADLNRPAGLIRSEGRAWLTAAVADPPSNNSGS